MTCSNEWNTTPPAGVASDHPLGSHAAQILATEHWSLLATRTSIWNEAMSRANVFLTVLSAAIIALALLADATGFGRQTTTLALVLLPMVLLLGVATYVRQVQMNNEEFKLVLAMNRLRHAYLTIEPGLEPYLTTGHHDDERGLVATYMLDHPSRRWLLVHFMINTPTIVATVDAALAAAIAVLVLQTAGAATAGCMSVCSIERGIPGGTGSVPPAGRLHWSLRDPTGRRPEPLPPRHPGPRPGEPPADGRMLWLRWKRLSGSYRSFSAASRASVPGL
jgi:hypothetical protein